MLVRFSAMSIYCSKFPPHPLTPTPVRGEKGDRMLLYHVPTIAHNCNAAITGVSGVFIRGV